MGNPQKFESHAVPEQTEDFRSGFVALVGPPNAGKSTLLNALLKKKVSIVSPRPQTTRHRITGVKNLPKAQLMFVDTPGFPGKEISQAFRKVLGRHVAEAASGADVIALVLDVTRLRGLESNLKSLESKLNYRLGFHPDFVLLNKIDLVSHAEMFPMLETLHQIFSESPTAQSSAESSESTPKAPKAEAEITPVRQVEVVPLSALKRDNIERLLSLFEERLPKGPAYFPAEMSSDQSEKTFVSEVIREKLFYLLHDEVPYSTAVSIETWEEQNDMLHIGATVLVERESQKGIVIGKGGAMLKEVGTRARKDIERLLDTKVFLKLHVRVQSNWSEYLQGLQVVGVVDGSE